jgi:hypothetical protein
MTDKFEMSMMGELKFFLVFEVRQLRGGAFINQAKYIQDMLKKFNMDSGVKGVDACGTVNVNHRPVGNPKRKV